MQRIGERIKYKRELMGFQLNELARKVGVSSSALSQIEKAKSNPTLFTLKLIADSLNTTVGELVGENEFLINNPIFRNDEAQLFEKNKSKTEVMNMSHHDISKLMDAFKVCFTDDSDSDGLFQHCKGQVFGYLLSGKIQFEIDNKSYIVQKGDTLYFDTKRNFRFQNISENKSELLCVSMKANQ